MSFNKLIELDTHQLEEEEEKKRILQMKQLANDTIILKEIMNDFIFLVKDQEIQIDTVDDKIIETNETITQTTDTLDKARKYQQTASIFKITGICTLIGVLCGGPLGALGGYYIGITIGGGIFGTIMGGGISGGTAYSIATKKKKNLKLKNKS